MILRGSLILSSLLLVGIHGWSQSEEMQVQRLEERLMVLEQKLFSNMSPSQASEASGSLLADFEARLQQLEEESRHVYGAMEQVGNTMSEIAGKLDMIAKDYDLRFQDIENTVANQMAIDKIGASSARNGGGDDIGDLLNDARAVASGTEDIEPADDLFSRGYSALTRALYDEALSAFESFTTHYADHEMASEAFYWLGEVYLVQDNPEQAAVAFSTGLTKDPESEKAPANLLKMGHSFKALEQVDMARGSWQKLIEDYPNSDEADEARQELDVL